MVLTTLMTIPHRKPFANSLDPLAHVYRPGISRVAREKSVLADFDRVVVDEVVVVADVPAI